MITTRGPPPPPAGYDHDHRFNGFFLTPSLREWLVLVGFWSIWTIAKQSQTNLPCLHTCDSCKDCFASRTVSFFYRQTEVALLLATHGARHQTLSDHCRQAVATACSVTLRSLQEPRRHVCLPPAPSVEWPEPRSGQVTDLLKEWTSKVSYF